MSGKGAATRTSKTDAGKTDAEKAEAIAQAHYVAACHKLTNWSAVFTGQLVGSMSGDDERGAKYREIFDRLLMLRAEINAVTGLVLLKNLCTEAELREAIGIECETLAEEFERTFPGIVSLPTPNQLQITNEAQARETMKGWPQ